MKECHLKQYSRCDYSIRIVLKSMCLTFVGDWIDNSRDVRDLHRLWRRQYLCQQQSAYYNAQLFHDQCYHRPHSFFQGLQIVQICASLHWMIHRCQHLPILIISQQVSPSLLRGFFFHNICMEGLLLTNRYHNLKPLQLFQFRLFSRCIAFCIIQFLLRPSSSLLKWLRGTVGSSAVQEL